MKRESGAAFAEYALLASLIAVVVVVAVVIFQRVVSERYNETVECVESASSGSVDGCQPAEMQDK